MGIGFVPGPRIGQHYELLKLAMTKLKSVTLSLKLDKENSFESAVAECLRSSPKLKKNLITQIGEDEVEKISKASLFGFSHRPDITIGNDGTAIEIKLVASSSQIRDILGQAIAYRTHYRFVILVIVDKTSERSIVATCQDKKGPEYSLLTYLAEEFNIYTIIGRSSTEGNNLVFAA